MALLQHKDVFLLLLLYNVDLSGRTAAAGAAVGGREVSQLVLVAARQC